ncbi:MAG: ribokinase [Candidatus Helarchaeota archaeon]
MSKKPHILIIGSSNTDLTIKSEKLPSPGETVIGNEFFIASGGKGANQAVAARRAGANVTFIAKIGDDDFGRNNIQLYQNDGINTDHILIDKNNYSGIALIMVDSKGENLISVASNSNYNFHPKDIESKKEIIKTADIILIQNEIPDQTNLTVINMAFDLKIPLIFNPAPGPKKPLSSTILKKIKYLTPNKKELELVTGKLIKEETDIYTIGQELVQSGIENLILTLGNKGSLLINKNETIAIPAFKVDAIDTVGAGDCFNGYLGAMLASGKSLYDSIKIASAAAAISVTKRGAQPSIPNYNEVVHFIETH